MLELSKVGSILRCRENLLAPIFYIFKGLCSMTTLPSPILPRKYQKWTKFLRMYKNVQDSNDLEYTKKS